MNNFKKIITIEKKVVYCANLRIKRKRRTAQQDNKLKNLN